MTPDQRYNAISNMLNAERQLNLNLANENLDLKETISDYKWMVCFIIGLASLVIILVKFRIL